MPKDMHALAVELLLLVVPLQSDESLVTGTGSVVIMMLESFTPNNLKSTRPLRQSCPSRPA